MGSKRIIPGTNAILLNSDGTFLSQHKTLVQPLTNLGDTFQVAQSDGTSVLIVDTINKYIGINQSSPGAMLQIDAATATTKALILKMAAGQTQNGFEVQDSAGNVLSGVDERGIPFADGNTSALNYFAGTGAGDVAATGTQIVAIGRLAGASITTASNTVLIGASAGLLLESGNSNVALGANALSACISGADNFALGNSTLSSCLSGNNIAIGSTSAQFTLNGVRNISIGTLASRYQQNGTGNTHIGYNAGTNTGLYSADYCVFIGYQAGYLTTGSSDVFIGSNAGYRQVAVSNMLLIDNQQRADAATELTHAILYGTMAANPEDQQLTINVDSLTIGTDADADVVMNWVANTNSGTLTWMEDEDYFDFSDTLKTSAARIKSTTRIDSGDSPYTTTNTDDVIFADTDGGAITVNLQAGVDGRRLRIINCGSSGNDVTIEGDGAEEVRQAANQLVADSEIMILVYNATEGWF